ncbi:S41 family peptidase [Effusibacillus pohliae]|uniref:S41 family peptidase n=1 Tax=Effusibacillus pohliae TaxID=232270 RepID=UPI00036388C0|nr:S41 family peptidase [Effusibacillus pohliae]
MWEWSWRKKWTAAVLAAGLAVPAGAAVFPASVLAEEQSISKNEATLFQVFETLRDLHWSNIGENKLLRGAVQGMLDALNDPYSEYFTAEEYQEFVNAINQSYAGIGIRLGQDESGYLVDEVFPSSPAVSAGLKKGDRILAIDGHDTKGKPIQEVSGWIRGQAGSAVTLTIERAGQNPFSVTVTRRAITLPAVTSTLLDPETGYIRILSFSESAGQEFDLALADLQRKGIKSLVLDVRGNGGGLLDSAVHIADRFLREGLIVQLKERQSEQQINADLEGVDLPVAVLVDQGSASASELLAGALQANHRAKLIGQRTYGKGVMQRGMQLANGDILKLTVGQFYFADGSSPQGSGLKPDRSVAIKELQVPVALETLHPERSKAVRFDLTNQKTYVNQVEVAGQKTIVKNGKRYVPLRFVLEALGSEVTWNPQERSILFQYKGRNYKLSVSNDVLSVNGQDLQINTPFFIESGVSYLSIEAVQAALQPNRLSISPDSIEIAD